MRRLPTTDVDASPPPRQRMVDIMATQGNNDTNVKEGAAAGARPFLCDQASAIAVTALLSSVVAIGQGAASAQHSIARSQTTLAGSDTPRRPQTRS